MKKIIVYCEINPETCDFEEASFELLSKARELKLSARFIATNAQVNIADTDYYIEAVALAKELNQESVYKAIKAGADRVVLLKNDYFETFIQTDIAKTFVKYHKTSPAEIIIFPATPTGRIVAPRITTLLNTGLVADCTGLEFALVKNELKLAPTRPTFGSELMATILSKKNPQCATIRPGTFKADFVDIDEIKNGQYFENIVQLHSTEQRIKYTNLIKETMVNEVDFSKAKVVLAGGWGICSYSNQEHIKKLQKIAAKLGVNFATTRKVVEAGFIEKTHQIGQTGSSTTAELYIAFGISGAIQHIQGMKNCKKIIAINSDPNAEIFKYCDYKIIADAKELIDEMFEITQQA